MAEIVDIARGALNAQPFSALLGTKLMQVDSSSLTLCLTIRDELRQQHGFVHGGVVSYLVDNALTFAGALRRHDGRKRRPSPINLKACNSRNFRHS